MMNPVAADTFAVAALTGARQVGTVYKGAPVVVIREQVLEDVIEFSEQELTRERGGFLLGGVYGESPQYVIIRHFHAALEAQGSGASLTFTHETWARLTRELETNFPQETLLGWQHTHPGFGVFLSGYDLFIHKHFFAPEWQIALVVDPKRQELAFFHWRDGEVKDCGFLCVDDG